MPSKGNYMDDLHQFMLEHEEFLEKALEDMEYGALLTDDQVAAIRCACGKPKKRNDHVHDLLRDVVNDFGKIFRGAQ